MSAEIVGSNNAMLPSSSIEQYGASLARWYGLSESQIDTVFPRLPAFASRDLGFLATPRTQIMSSPSPLTPG